MKTTLLEIIKREGLVYNKEGKRFVNLFKLTTTPAYLRIMAQSLVQIMESRPDMIASPSIESDPVVTALSLETGIPFVCIHGGKILYGEVQKRSLVDVVADVTLTGETALSTVKTIKDLGRVGKVYAVVDLEEGAKEKLAAEGVELIPLIRVKEL